MKRVMDFRQKGKLSPRYVRDFKVLEKVDTVTHRLALSPAMSGLHDIFHNLMLRKFVAHLEYILKHPEVEIMQDLKHNMHLEKVLDRREKKLRNKTVPLNKVKWEGHSAKEATWEREDEIREKYPALL